MQAGCRFWVAPVIEGWLTEVLCPAEWAGIWGPPANAWGERIGKRHPRQQDLKGRTEDGRHPLHLSLGQTWGTGLG